MILRTLHYPLFELIDLLNNHNQLASKVSNSSNQNLALNQDGYDHIIIDISYEDIECENENNLVGAHIIGIGLDDLKKATDEFAQLPNVNITYISPEQILNDKNV